MGTYSYSFVGAAGSIFPATGQGTLVFGANNSLCVNGTTLTNPVSPEVDKDGAGSLTQWLVPNGNYLYQATGVQDFAGLEALTALGSLQVYQVVNGQKAAGGAAGAFVQLTRVSSSTTCSSTVLVSDTGITTPPTTTPTVSATVQSVFDLAAEIYPTLFVNGSALGTYQGYTYKYFPASKIYVGIKDDKIYTLGGPFGDAIKEQGSSAAVLTALQHMKSKM